MQNSIQGTGGTILVVDEGFIVTVTNSNGPVLFNADHHIIITNDSGVIWQNGDLKIILSPHPTNPMEGKLLFQRKDLTLVEITKYNLHMVAFYQGYVANEIIEGIITRVVNQFNLSGDELLLFSRIIRLRQITYDQDSQALLAQLYMKINLASILPAAFASANYFLGIMRQ